MPYGYVATLQFHSPITCFRDMARLRQHTAARRRGASYSSSCVVDQQPADAAEDTPTRMWSMRHAHRVSMLGKDAHATQLVVAFIISSALPAFGTGSHRKPDGAVRGCVVDGCWSSGRTLFSKTRVDLALLQQRRWRGWHDRRGALTARGARHGHGAGRPHRGLGLGRRLRSSRRRGRRALR